MTSNRSPGTAARFANAYKRNESGGEVVSLRLPSDVIERVKKVGDAEGLSQSDTVRLLISRGLTVTETKLTEDERVPLVKSLMAIVQSLETKEDI